jgi:uncharacterized protein (DUF433 family)
MDEAKLSDRMQSALDILNEVVDIDVKKAGGKPCLIGTRFTLAQVFAEIAEGKSIIDLSKDFNLNKSHIEGFLRSISICFDQSFVSKPKIKEKQSV